MERFGGVRDGGCGGRAGSVDSRLSEAEEDYYVTVPLCEDVCFGKSFEENRAYGSDNDRLQRIGLLQHPRLHIERALLLRLQPAVNAMGMERVVTHTPSNLSIRQNEQTYFAVALLS